VPHIITAADMVSNDTDHIGIMAYAAWHQNFRKPISQRSSLVSDNIFIPIPIKAPEPEPEPEPVIEPEPEPAREPTPPPVFLPPPPVEPVYQRVVRKETVKLNKKSTVAIARTWRINFTHTILVGKNHVGYFFSIKKIIILINIHCFIRSVTNVHNTILTNKCLDPEIKFYIKKQTLLL
jgi:hypothetical protein